MVELSKELITEMRIILEKEYKKKLSFEEASDAANSLVDFFEILHRIDSRGKRDILKTMK